MVKDERPDDAMPLSAPAPVASILFLISAVPVTGPLGVTKINLTISRRNPYFLEADFWFAGSTYFNFRMARDPGVSIHTSRLAGTNLPQTRFWITCCLPTRPARAVILDVSCDQEEAFSK